MASNTENVSIWWRHHVPCPWEHALMLYGDVIEWKHFPSYWLFVRGIHRSPVNSPHKGQWRGTLMFSLTCAWPNTWANNEGADDLKGHRAHYDVIAMDNSDKAHHQGWPITCTGMVSFHRSHGNPPIRRWDTIRSYQEPITEEHPSTIGVCDNCPPLKEVINSP